MNKKQTDDVEKLADELISCSDSIDVKLVKEVWKAGYNKAKETYKYTEENLRTVMIIATSKMINNRIDLAVFDDIIQSLKQPKLHAEFECEIEQYTQNLHKDV